MKIKYYSLTNILKRKAQYNIIFGERSNGKTYSVLKYALERSIKNHEQFAIIRRWQDDFKGKRANSMFSALVDNKEIEKLTNGMWTNVNYSAGRWYLAIFDEELNKWVTDNEPIAFAFAISATEHDKSSSYPRIKTILFDEFLTRGMYLPDEFVSFMNVISTIVRYRNDVTIFMLGNTVNKYSPYFSEMGLVNISKMKQGDIDVYQYGDTDLKVAVEYADSLNKSKPSDTYFAFNNPKLHMITGGAWEMEIYPHCPCKYKPNEILFIYFIKFEVDILQCEIVQHEDLLFTFIHKKTTELKDSNNDIIFSPEFNPRPNWKRKITKPTSQLEKKIASFFVNDKVFYQSNEIGEIVRNYLLWCKNDK